MHPKNSIMPHLAQHPVTAAHEMDEVFSVRPGAPSDDVLELVSVRLSEAILFAHDSIEKEEGIKLGGLYLLEQHLISAKAMVDAVVRGLSAYPQAEAGQ